MLKLYTSRGPVCSALRAVPVPVPAINGMVLRGGGRHRPGGGWVDAFLLPPGQVCGGGLRGATYLLPRPPLRQGGGVCVRGGTYMLPHPHPTQASAGDTYLLPSLTRRGGGGGGGRGGSALEESRSFGNKSETCFWSKIEMFSSIDTKQRQSRNLQENMKLFI